MTSTLKGWGWGWSLEVFHVFADSIDFKQQIHYSILRVRGHTIGLLCGRHKCMTLTQDILN